MRDRARWPLRGASRRRVRIPRLAVPPAFRYRSSVEPSGLQAAPTPRPRPRPLRPPRPRPLRPRPRPLRPRPRLTRLFRRSQAPPAASITRFPACPPRRRPIGPSTRACRATSARTPSPSCLCARSCARRAWAAIVCSGRCRGIRISPGRASAWPSRCAAAIGIAARTAIPARRRKTSRIGRRSSRATCSATPRTWPLLRRWAGACT